MTFNGGRSGSQSPSHLRTLCRALLLHSQSLYHQHRTKANVDASNLEKKRMEEERQRKTALGFARAKKEVRVAPLWTGAVSDTDYNKRAGYLEEQDKFAKDDMVSGKHVPFLNIYDKGYRAKLVAHRAGRQRVVQPDFAESDKRFNRNQTLRSASIATDRAGMSVQLM